MKRLYDKALMDQIAKVYGNEVTFLSEFSNALLDIIREGLIRDGQVRLHQFGTFKLKWMKSRAGVNPSTGEKIIIQARPRVLFVPAKYLKERIEPNPPALQPFDQTEDIVSTDEFVSVKINPENEADSAVHFAKADELNSVQNNTLPSEPESDLQESNLQSSEPEQVVTDIQDEIKILEQVVSILKTEADGAVDITSKESVKDTNWLDQSVVEKIQEIAELQYFKKEDNSAAEQPANSDLISGQNETAELDINTDSLSQKTDDSDTQTIEKTSVKPWLAIAATILVLLATAVLFNVLESDKSAQIALDDKQASVLPMAPRYLYSYETNLSVSEPVIAPPVHVPVEIIIDNAELETLASDTVNVVTDSPEAIDSKLGENVTESIVVSTEAYDELKRVSSEQNVFFSTTEHKLTNGDSLWRLASKHYVNPFYWPHIYQANHNKIDNPDKVKIGKVINLPTLYGKPDNLTQQDKHNIAIGYYYNYLYHKAKGNPFAYFSLIGVEKFDPTLLIEFKDEIEHSDVENLAMLTV